MQLKEEITNRVSETALITIRSRVTESRKRNPLIVDPMGEKLFLKLLDSLDGQTHYKVLNGRLPRSLSLYIALRARKYDLYVKDFLNRYPNGLVISLGSGFDTRYWRCSLSRLNYIEVDLPELIILKSKILGRELDFEAIPMSVLNEQLWNVLESRGNSEVLFLAEGLLMYLPSIGVREIFNNMASRFSKSEFVFEVVNEKYTRGMWKKMVERKMRSSLGSDAGSSYQFGIKDKGDIEKLSYKFKVIEEWSYFDDPDVKPKFLHFLRNWKSLSRTQWTVNMVVT